MLIIFNEKFINFVINEIEFLKFEGLNIKMTQFIQIFR